MLWVRFSATLPQGLILQHTQTHRVYHTTSQNSRVRGTTGSEKIRDLNTHGHKVRKGGHDGEHNVRLNDGRHKENKPGRGKKEEMGKKVKKKTSHSHEMFQ